MADKEATVYIVDLGKSMGERHSEGRLLHDETDLDYGMRYVWDKITTTMLADRKTWTVGVVGLRTDATDNPLSDEESYQNISILQALGPMQMPQLKKLQETLRVGKTESGDAISAIIVAIEMIERFTKKLKYLRKIVLMTNGRGPIDADGMDEIVKKLNEENIELIIVGVDFDDPEFGFKEEDKDLVKASNEALLKSLSEQCEKGAFGTAAEAVQDISVPRVKPPRPYKTFDGQLTLGDPNNYNTAMCIDVERYFKTKPTAAPTASSFVSKVGGESAQSSHTINAGEDTAMGGTDANGLAAVKNSRTYKVKDVSAAGGFRELEREELSRGYEYGRTAVHIAESDQNVTKLETVKNFTIIGFIPCEKHESYFNMGETCITIAQKTNDKARMALSSLIHSLYELDSYAVARIVLKDGKDPQLLLLAPSIEPDLESLIDIPLPFAEDVRLYRFPPLDRVLTVSGNVLTKHRNLPTDNLINAMDAFVDSMDISKFGIDDEGKEAEYMEIGDSYAPVLHRINQNIKRRAVQPDEPIQPPAAILVKFSNPPGELVEESQDQLESLIAAADVKKVPTKAKGRRKRNTAPPLSGLDIDELLNNDPKRKMISSDNAIPEFKQMMAKAEDSVGFKEAAKQMGSIIRTLIKDSFGESGYGKALANLAVMREELTEWDEPEIYNDYVKTLKNQLFGGELGDGRNLFFWEIKKMKLGLINQKNSEYSGVSDEMATEFYAMKIANS